MMLMHPIFSTPICFEENKINVLVVENPKMLSDMILMLLEQINSKDGKFVLSKNYTPIEISKEIELIINPFEIDANQRKIITKLYQKLTSIAIGEEHYLQTKEVLGYFIKYLEDLLQQIDYPLSFCDEFDLMNLFKIADVKLNLDCNNLIEKIIDYLTIFTDLCKISCFVFLNLKSYLNDEEILELYKFIEYKKIKILLIESLAREALLNVEQIRIIDADLCEIY